MLERLEDRGLSGGHFLILGGVVAIQESGGEIDIWAAMTTLTVFLVIMSLGVWHVFRKRGRIYI